MTTDRSPTGFFRLSNTVLTNVIAQAQVIRVEAEAEAPVFEACCETPALVRNGFRAPRQTINDIPHDRPVIMLYRTARARCRVCGADVSERLEHKQEGWR